MLLHPARGPSSNKCILQGLCLITPYHPQVKINFVSSTYLFGSCVPSNGLDERFTQTFPRILVKAITGKQGLWDEFIDSVVFAYNTSCHESSCYAPFEVMFGHKAVLPIDVDVKSVSLDKFIVVS